MRPLSIRAALAFTIISVCCRMHAADAAATLARVRSSGILRCGIDVEQAEYSTSDDHGNRQAFDADLCRAVGVAVLGKNAQIKMLHFPDDRTSMQALTNGDVDLIATLTDDFTHRVGTHIEFTRPMLWDGVGFLLPTGSPVNSARQLAGKKICFIAETAVEESVRAWFHQTHLNFVPFPFQEDGEMQAAFATGNCGALAGDQTRLAQFQTALSQHQQHARLLPERISKDPLAAATLDTDQQWAEVVNWVMEALVQAEESGVTQANVSRKQALAASPEGTDPTLRFLLGASRQIGTALQLNDDWVARVIEATGNYGEIYERDLGAASVMKLPRGDNNLHARGGMMMALPPK